MIKIYNLLDQSFIDRITTINVIPTEYLNDRMLAFFDLRYGKKPRVSIIASGEGKNAIYNDIGIEKIKVAEKTI